MFRLSPRQVGIFVFGFLLLSFFFGKNLSDNKVEPIQIDFYGTSTSQETQVWEKTLLALSDQYPEELKVNWNYVAQINEQGGLSSYQAALTSSVGILEYDLEENRRRLVLANIFPEKLNTYLKRNALGEGVSSEVLLEEILGNQINYFEKQKLINSDIWLWNSSVIANNFLSSNDNLKLPFITINANVHSIDANSTAVLSALRQLDNRFQENLPRCYEHEHCLALDGFEPYCSTEFTPAFCKYEKAEAMNMKVYRLGSELTPNVLSYLEKWQKRHPLLSFEFIAVEEIPNGIKFSVNENEVALEISKNFENSVHFDDYLNNGLSSLDTGEWWLTVSDNTQ